MREPLLTVRDLRVTFPISRNFLGRVKRRIHAVDGVNFSIGEGETLGLVGESGSGKSTTARAILGLTRPSAGEIELDGRQLVGLSAEAMRSAYRDMQVVFQDPMSSLNPRMTAEQNVAEPLVNFDSGTASQIAARVKELFEQVGLRADQLGRYPHEFSGGQRQRLCIARAMAIRPKLIICDEPVSALDVSVQAQVINLLGDLSKATGVSILFVAHDLAVVEHISDRVAVMFQGQIVEIGETPEIYANPMHPYTKKLLASVLHADPSMNPALPPSVAGGTREAGAGCRFAPQCPSATPTCQTSPPVLRRRGQEHEVACHLA